MVIIYPHNQRFFLRRAHDILVMKTCHALARQGHEVYLLMGKTSKDTSELTRYYGLEPHPRLHFVQLPMLRRDRWPRLSWHGVFNFFCFRQIKRMLATVKPDVIYLSEIKFGHALLKKFPRLPVPVVYEAHGITGKNYVEPRALEAEVFRRSDALITTTDSLRQMIRRLYPDAAPTFRVSLATEVPDVEAFRPPPAGEPWRLCYVGQLYPLQGVDILIRAIASLDDSVQLNIYGGKQEHIDDLKSLAEELGVGERINFHGFVSPHEVLKRAASSHVCVIPCRADKKMSFVAHTKLYEYLALGRPIITADLPSIREEVKDGENALLFTPGDDQALATAIRQLITNTKLAHELAQGAFYTAGRFTWEARTEALAQVFRTIRDKD